MNFVPAVAYHFCLNLPAAFSQPRNGLIAKPCNGARVAGERPFERENAKEDRFRSGKREGASRKNNLAETRVGGWLKIDREGYLK